MKRPASQFFWGDWRRDTALQSCSLEARGLWIEMLCLMHEGEPYGHLQVGRKILQVPEIARLVGISMKRAKKLILELENAKTFSRNSGGTIYSRRMVRDEMTREKRAVGGAKSLENPNVPRPKGQLEGYPSDHPSTCPLDHPSGESFGGSPASASASASANTNTNTKSTGADAPVSPPSHQQEPDEVSHGFLCKVFAEIFDLIPDATEQAERLKKKCAELHVRYDSRSIQKAIDAVTHIRAFREPSNESRGRHRQVGGFSHIGPRLAGRPAT